MSATDIAFYLFVLTVLLAASIRFAMWTTRRPAKPTTRQTWQNDRQAAMQAVRDQWTCKQIAQLPTSTESND